MNSSRKTAINWLLGVLLSIFAATAFAADCKVNDSDISDEYIGSCVNGLAHGKGKAKGRDTYEGEFKQGNKHGKGTYIWAANGNKYEGDWLNAKRHGKGTETWSNGQKYIGDYVEGIRTGKGITIFTDGSRYEGEYRDGKRHGFGVLRFVKGNAGIQDHESQAETRGRWVGDIYVVQGVFVANEKGSDFILSCTSPQNCKQEQANREAQERREAADREASNRQACSRLYIGKPVSWPEGRTCVLFSCDNFTLRGQIVGVGNGVASAKVTESYKYGQVHEKACNEF